METVVLKNGATEALSLVATIMFSLEILLKTKPMALYELVMVCRDSTYKIFGNLGKDLRDRELLQADSQPHGSIKNIVLSAVEGEGLNLTIGNPVKMSKEKEEKCLTCIHKDGDGSVLYGAKICSQGHMIEVFQEESKTWKTNFSGCDEYETK